MPLAQPRNQRILDALSLRSPGQPALVRHDALPAADVYLHAGCHPDIVERLWDQLGAALPDDCRFLVHGTPALVHPGGLILALGIGTQYGLRLLPSAYAAAAQAGAKTVALWSDGQGMDIADAYGSDWVFGTWLASEADWCRAVHAACTHAPELLAAPSVAAPAAPRDFAAVATQAQQALQAGLEQRAAAGDLDATVALFEVLMNVGFKQRSWALLDRAGSLLAAAAAGAHPKALAMSAAWPQLRAEAERQFPRAASPG